MNEDLMEDLVNEFMELVKAGDRKAFDFALEYSDPVNHSLQTIGMQLMISAGPVSERLGAARAHAMAVWMVCARHAFLDVVEKEAALKWAEQEYPKCIRELEEIHA